MPAGIEPFGKTRDLELADRLPVLVLELGGELDTIAVDGQLEPRARPQPVSPCGAARRRRGEAVPDPEGRACREDGRRRRPREDADPDTGAMSRGPLLGGHDDDERMHELSSPSLAVRPSVAVGAQETLRTATRTRAARRAQPLTIVSRYVAEPGVDMRTWT